MSLSLLISLIGIYDQTTHPLPPKEVIASNYNNDSEFIQRISNTMPQGSMIFQLPYVSFPEGETLHNMGNYDLLKGYIHSSDLKWSFGVMKNSYGDSWMKELVKQPVKKAIDIMAYSGYTGIYIDRNGYSAEYVDKLEKELSDNIIEEPIESDNKELVFYDLRSYSNKLKASTGEEIWIERNIEALNKIQYGTERDITGDEGWELLQNKEGYKVIQTNGIADLPEDQLSILVKGPNDVSFTFGDEFSLPNNYSFRHWEDPKHFVISISNDLTGWDNNYSPTGKDISQFFKKIGFSLYYSQKNENQIILKE